jgi:hypothetical protein
MHFAVSNDFSRQIVACSRLDCFAELFSCGLGVELCVMLPVRARARLQVIEFSHGTAPRNYLQAPQPEAIAYSANQDYFLRCRTIYFCPRRSQRRVFFFSTSRTSLC